MLKTPFIAADVRSAIERIDRIAEKLNDAMGDLHDLVDELRETDPENKTLQAIDQWNRDAWNRLDPVKDSIYGLRQSAKVS